MKNLSRRTWIALVLAAVLLGGCGYFTAQFFLHGDEWVTFPGSPHVYSDGVLNSGVVTDRSGEMLLALDGGRHYAGDAVLRRTVLHILGDDSGNIPSPLLNKYAARLAGYHPVTGVQRMDQKTRTMTLTLSAPVQKAAYAALNGRKGTVAVYNYVNGEILCAVTSPAYDPTAPPAVPEDGSYVNRFTGSLYVPGSIFKLVTAAALLEEQGQTARNRTYACDGSLVIGADTVTCSGHHGTVTLSEALARSCNCAFARISLELGAEKLQRYAGKFGLTDRAYLDGFLVPAGQVLPGTEEISLAWSGIGQHTVMVNPCSFLRFVGAVAGGGSGAEMRFVNEAGSYRGKPRRTPQLLSAGTAELLAELMQNNVSTVYGAEKFPDISVCAKSGTAEVGEGQMPHATFAGFCRDEEYPLAFIVVVENGGSGSEVCASLAGKVLSACMEAMDRPAQ